MSTDEDEPSDWMLYDDTLAAELAQRQQSKTRTMGQGYVVQLKAKQAALAEKARKDHRALQNTERDAQNNFLRPALLVKNDKFEEPESQVWCDRLSPARAAIEAALPSIGRVDLTKHSHKTWAGTGWYVAEDIIATNRHVAVEFALGPSPHPFRINGAGQTLGCSLDSLREHGKTEQRVVAVRRVLWIAPDDNMAPDVAFLQVEPGSGAPPLPLRLERAQTGEWIAAIGYPEWDGYRNDEDEMMAMFHGIYAVKRVSPGAVMSSGKEHFFHDCTTLGGNSGSAVFHLASGKVLGLHSGGRYKRHNYAVHAYRVAELLAKYVTHTEHG